MGFERQFGSQAVCEWARKKRIRSVCGALYKSSSRLKPPRCLHGYLNTSKRPLKRMRSFSAPVPTPSAGQIDTANRVRFNQILSTWFFQWLCFKSQAIIRGTCRQYRLLLQKKIKEWLSAIEANRHVFVRSPSFLSIARTVWRGANTCGTFHLCET